jgi:long-subunit fatty acid transport protein
MHTPKAEHAVLFAGVSLAAGLFATAAFPAAIERAIPSTTRIIFEEGRYIEFGIAYADPDQSGDDVTLPPLLSPTGTPLSFQGNTGDVFDGHWNFSGSYRADINERWSYALLFDQPFGADTTYGNGPMTGPAGVFNYDGTNAELNTFQITGVLAYDLQENMKIYGGLRAQRLDANAAIPFVGPTAGLPGYTVDTNEDWGYGYMLGWAYEKPEIALRVALTFHSAIDHDLKTTEFGGITIPGLQDGDTETNVTTPQSAMLEFQTGVAANTLVFGSVRWVDWSEFAIEPPSYVAATSGRPLVDYASDWWTYNLGAGYQFREDFAASLSVTYEPSVGGELTTLGPYDGRTTLNLGAAYDVNDNLNLSGGLVYGVLGDTYNVLDTDFNDGTVWGAGLRIGYSF